MGAPLVGAGSRSWIAALALVLAAAGLAAAGPAPADPGPAAPTPDPATGPGTGAPAPGLEAPEEPPTEGTPTTPELGDPPEADGPPEAPGSSPAPPGIPGDPALPEDPSTPPGVPDPEADLETLPEPEGECRETPLLRVWVVVAPDGPVGAAGPGPPVEEVAEVNESVDDPRDHPAVECVTGDPAGAAGGVAPPPLVAASLAAPTHVGVARDGGPGPDPAVRPPDDGDGPSRGTPTTELSVDAADRLGPPEAGVAPGAVALALAAAAVPVAAFLYRRLTRDGHLENETRRTVLDLVTAEPGITAAEVSEALDVHYRTARHHLDVLEDFGEVEAERIGRRIRWFEADGCYGPTAKRLVGCLDTETKRGIIMTVARRGALASSEVGDAVDVAPSTASHHLGELEDLGLVESRRDGRSVLYSLADGVLPALLELAPRPGDGS